MKTTTLCDDCGQPVDGYAFGHIGETLCFACFWEYHEETQVIRDHIQQMREAFCHCGTCSSQEARETAPAPRGQERLPDRAEGRWRSTKRARRGR